MPSLTKEQTEILNRKSPGLASLIEFTADRIAWLRDRRPKDSRGQLMIVDDQLEAGLLIKVCDEQMRVLRTLL